MKTQDISKVQVIFYFLIWVVGIKIPLFLKLCVYSCICVPYFTIKVFLETSNFVSYEIIFFVAIFILLPVYSAGQYTGRTEMRKRRTWKRILLYWNWLWLRSALLYSFYTFQCYILYFSSELGSYHFLPNQEAWIILCYCVHYLSLQL